MNIRSVARYFACGLLLVPLGLVLTWLIIRFLPGLANFLHTVFQTSLGQISAFSQASAILESLMSLSEFSARAYIAQFLVLLLTALSDTLIIGCCIFFVKTIFTKFNRKWEGRFTKPLWLITLVGVVAGVCICSVKGVLAANGQAILTLVTCLACYIGGIVLLCRSTWFTRGGTYHNRWAGFVIKLMTGILSDAFDAVCGIFVATAVMEGEYFAKQGGNGVACICFIVISCLMLFVKDALLDLMKPRIV